MTSINPYLNLNGNCEEAFKFYRDEAEKIAQGCPIVASTRVYEISR